MKTITTDGISMACRARFWREAISDTFVTLDCRIPDKTPFSGRLRQSQIGALSYTRVDAGGQHVSRPVNRLANEEEFILVSVGTSGRGVLRQDCREVGLEVGTFAVYDTVRPYELHFDAPFSQAVVRMPRSLLKSRLGMTEHVTAVALDGKDPLVQLTRDYLLALGRFDGDGAIREGDRIMQQAVDLLAMTLRSPHRPGGVSTVPRATLLARIKQQVELNLANADFGLTALGASLDISGRYVNSLFGDENTSFGRYLLMRRLARCAEDLRAPGLRHRTINDVAFCWGFNNPSHFSATFRKRYGVSARVYRAESAAPPTTPHTL